jgi:hypothetical protein
MVDGLIGVTGATGAVLAGALAVEVFGVFEVLAVEVFVAAGLLAVFVAVAAAVATFPVIGAFTRVSVPF